ncbi:MAG: HNH endonuclease signature motif containing protein [Janthinobacterium sp.]|jgi:5-methylcytosine-specific restriction endonuclease McrA
MEGNKLCIVCKKRKREVRCIRKDGTRRLRKKCIRCATNPERYKRIYLKRRVYLKYKKDYCEECGFKPKDTCQLDVDHVDGNRKNNDPSNLRTLCANCHRLKTKEHGDYSNNKYQYAFQENQQGSVSISLRKEVQQEASEVILCD